MSLKRIDLTGRPHHATVAPMPLRTVCSLMVAAALAGSLDARQATFAVPATAPKSSLAVPTAPKAPWFAAWQLVQPAAAGRFESPAYKKVTLRIEPWEDGLRVVYDMVRTRGGITHMEWEGRFDGKDYPVQGMDYFLTNAYRPLDDRSYEIIIKVDGRVAANAIAVVSPDGKVLTVTTIEKDASGRTVKTNAEYRRVM